MIKIKPLTWHGEPEWCFADTPVGHYTICRRQNPHCYRVDSHGRDRMQSFDAPNAEEAKAAAQKDFERRVLSCLDMDEKCVSSPETEQPDFTYYECPECGFDAIHKADYEPRSTACPICAGDSGHDVGMNSRTARSTDKPEGKDARDLPGERP